MNRWQNCCCPSSASLFRPSNPRRGFDTKKAVTSKAALPNIIFFFSTLNFRRCWPSLNATVRAAWQMQIHGDPVVRSPPWASLIRLQLQHIKAGWITHLPCGRDLITSTELPQIPLCSFLLFRCAKWVTLQIITHQSGWLYLFSSVSTSPFS